MQRNMPSTGLGSSRSSMTEPSSVWLRRSTDPEEIPIPKPKTPICKIQQLFDGSLPVSTLPQLDENTATSSQWHLPLPRMFTEHQQQGRRDASHPCRPRPLNISDDGIDTRIPALEPVTMTPANSGNPKYEPINLGNFEVKALATAFSTYRWLKIQDTFA